MSFASPPGRCAAALVAVAFLTTSSGCVSWRGVSLDDSQALARRVSADPDQRVAIDVESGERYEVRARDLEVRDDVVVVRKSGSADPIEIPLQDVSRVSTREFSWWKTSALTLGVLAVTSAVVILVVIAVAGSANDAFGDKE